MSEISKGLAALREKLKQQEQRQTSSASDNAIYRFWDMKPNDVAVVRFLPDDGPNDFFWVEKNIIKLPFTGIVGQSSSVGKKIEVQVPCMEMYGDNEVCPILSEIRPWFKVSGKEDLARSYWKKRTYVFQGFVRDNPLLEDDVPENPIRRFVITPQLFEQIKVALMDPEIEELPVDYTNGTDFKIMKTQQGEYSNWTKSSWSRKSSSLTDDELNAIQTYGLRNLRDFLPKKPGSKELEVIQEMFHASVNGDMFDNEKWGEYYRPFGLDAPNKSSSGSYNNDSDNDDNDSDTPFETNSSDNENKVTQDKENINVEDLLSKIKNRAKQ